MGFHVINTKRLLFHLDQDVRKRSTGVLNWRIDQIGNPIYPPNRLTLTLHIQGVDYIYMVAFRDLDEIPAQISSLLTFRNATTGYIESSDLSYMPEATNASEDPVALGLPESVPVDMAVFDNDGGEF